MWPSLLLPFPGIFLRLRLPPHTPFQIPPSQIFLDSSHWSGSSGTGKDNRIKSSMKETPFSRYLKAALGGLPLWPRSFCCQHFRRFVCDFIRSQNNSQKGEENGGCKLPLYGSCSALSLQSESLFSASSSEALFTKKCTNAFLLQVELMCISDATTFPPSPLYFILLIYFLPYVVLLGV